MSQRIQLRRGTAAEWTTANPTLAAGEIGVETDTGQLKVGDGVTAWSTLAYYGGTATSTPTLAHDVYVVEDSGTYKALTRGGTLATDTNPWSVIDAAIASQPERSASVLLGRMEAALTAPIVLGNNTRLQGIGSLMTSQVNGAYTHTYNPQTVLDFSGSAINGIETQDSAAIDYRCHGVHLADLTIVGSGAANARSGIFFNKNELREAVGDGFIGKVGLGRVLRTYVEGFQYGINLDHTADSCWVMDCHVHNVNIGIRDGSSECWIQRNSLWSFTGAGAIAIESTGSRGVIRDNEIQPGVSTKGVTLTGSHNVVSGNCFNPVSDAITVSGTYNHLSDNSFVTATNQIIDTGSNNQHGAFRGVKVARRLGTQSIANATEEYVSWDAEEWDTAGLFTSGTPTRVTIPAWMNGRKVAITAGASYATNATGRRFIKVMKNRATLLTAESQMANSSGGTQLTAAGQDQVATGDYFEVNVRQESGGALNLDPAAGPTYFTLHLLD